MPLEGIYEQFRSIETNEKMTYTVSKKKNWKILYNNEETVILAWNYCEAQMLALRHFGLNDRELYKLEIVRLNND